MLLSVSGFLSPGRLRNKTGRPKKGDTSLETGECNLFPDPAIVTYPPFPSAMFPGGTNLKWRRECPLISRNSLFKAIGYKFVGYYPTTIPTIARPWAQTRARGPALWAIRSGRAATDRLHYGDRLVADRAALTRKPQSQFDFSAFPFFRRCYVKITNEYIRPSHIGRKH